MIYNPSLSIPKRKTIRYILYFCDNMYVVLTSNSSSSLPFRCDPLQLYLTSPCSSHFIIMLSLSHTPVVHTDKGPKGCGTPVVSPKDSFSAVKAPSLNSRDRVYLSAGGIRLARTTSIKIWSPTMMSSRSQMGEGGEAKYERIAVIHEYAGMTTSYICCHKNRKYNVSFFSLGR